MVAIDEAAAQAHGHEVAESLIALQRPLLECCLACGFDESAANGLFALLVADLSRPDALRSRHASTPLAEQIGESPTITGHASLLSIGQTLVSSEPGQAPVALRVAWVSPLSARHLLINRQGVRQGFLLPNELTALRDAGRLRVHSSRGAVEGVLCALAEAATEAAIASSAG